MANPLDIKCPNRTDACHPSNFCHRKCGGDPRYRDADRHMSEAIASLRKAEVFLAPRFGKELVALTLTTAESALGFVRLISAAANDTREKSSGVSTKAPSTANGGN